MPCRVRLCCGSTIRQSSRKFDRALGYSIAIRRAGDDRTSRAKLYPVADLCVNAADPHADQEGHAAAHTACSPGWRRMGRCRGRPDRPDRRWGYSEADRVLAVGPNLHSNRHLRRRLTPAWSGIARHLEVQSFVDLEVGHSRRNGRAGQLPGRVQVGNADPRQPRHLLVHGYALTSRFIARPVSRGRLVRRGLERHAPTRAGVRHTVVNQEHSRGWLRS